VWQAKDLGERVFGSVASKGVTGEILEVWQGKDLADFWGKAGNGCKAQKRTARRGRMDLVSLGTDKAFSSAGSIIPYRNYMSRVNTSLVDSTG